jgi:hypothetical protein
MIRSLPIPEKVEGDKVVVVDPDGSRREIDMFTAIQHWHLWNDIIGAIATQRYTAIRYGDV